MVILRHNRTLWLLLDTVLHRPIIDGDPRSILVVNAKTGHKMWADRGAFEVISECR